jgi:lipid-A-disaccharide synthase-like uncharacterized protein
MTLWKLVGFAGTILFGARWLAQFLASRRAGRSVVGASFWLLTLAGSSTLIIYFTLGPSADSVGVVGNLLPWLTALYNLSLLTRPSAPGHARCRACLQAVTR